MHSWFKTCRVLKSLLTARIVLGPVIVMVAIILFGASALPQSDSESLTMSARELARRVVTNELKVQDEGHGHWMYRLEKEESGKKQVQEILETNIGSLSRLLSIAGHPLNAKQRQKENQRLQKLVSHPDEQRKLQQASHTKAEQGARLFKILPDVFMFSYAARLGDLVTLTFRPSPNFQPPSLEARFPWHARRDDRRDQTREISRAQWPSLGGCEIRRRTVRTLGQGEQVPG